MTSWYAQTLCELCDYLALAGETGLIIIINNILVYTMYNTSIYIMNYDHDPSLLAKTI